jgi:hypothetical protein
MKPQAEQKSLAEHPLPSQVVDSRWDYGKAKDIPKTEVLNTVVHIDDDIDNLSIIIQFLQEQRQKLITRASTEDIKANDGAVLIEHLGKQYRNPINDIEHFKTTFPGAYSRIRVTQKTALDNNYQRAIECLDVSGITLTEADEDLGKDVVTAFVGVKPQVMTYEVRKIVKEEDDGNSKKNFIRNHRKG